MEINGKNSPQAQEHITDFVSQSFFETICMHATHPQAWTVISNDVKGGQNKIIFACIECELEIGALISGSR